VNISNILSPRELWRRTVDSLRKPKEFFSDIKPEKGITRPFLFMTVVMAVTMLFLTYQHITIFNSFLAEVSKIYSQFGIVIPLDPLEINFKSYLMVYTILVASFIVTSFLWYYVTHVCVVIVGGRQGYDQTYKAMTYSLSADYLTLPAFIVSLVSLSIALTKDSMTATIVFYVSTILYMIPAFYRLYIRLVALEKLQNLSKVRGFVAAYVMAYIGMFFVILIIDVIILMLFLWL